jgi:transglutaminase-like putative cysteine protease
MARLSNPLKLLLSKLPPMPSQPPTHEARRDTLLQLAALIGVAVLVHFKIANLSIAFFALAIFALKTSIIIGKLSIPPRLVMMILTIASLGMVIYVYGGWNGQQAGISFLILLVALKFLESQSLRDYYVVCLLLYFLGASSFLFDSSILNIIIVLAYTLAITSILFQISNPAKVPLKKTLITSASMVARALPLAIILFFLFPRIHGDFGFIPSSDKANDASSLSDSLVAGEMASSAFNNELAFRVEFKGGNIPQRSQMYWRAKTMPTESNFQWIVSEPNINDFAAAKEIKQSSNLEVGQWRYQILHEKSNDKYLPYLDYISTANKGRTLPDYSVYLARPETGAFSYEGSSTANASSATNFVSSFAAPRDREYLLALTSKPNAKLQRLLQQWRDGAENDTVIVDRVYKHFANNPFSYSLMPPPLDEDQPLSDFLFNTREGYCEHYASAFTVIMRMLGVPSRVVVGYQGGTSVNNDQFIEVRYSDAHAWSEVWIDDQWLRVDPTASISPERIKYGMEALMELWESGLLGSNNIGRALENRLNPTGFNRTLRGLKDSWKNAAYQWNKWVVNYDFNTQRQLLEKVGVKHRNSVSALIVIMLASALTLLLFYFWQLVPRRIKRNKTQTQYLRFIRKFKRFKMTKENSETPQEFASRAVSLFPQRAGEINDITQTYYRLRYTELSGEREPTFDKFKLLVKKFKLKR